MFGDRGLYYARVPSRLGDSLTTVLARKGAPGITIGLAAWEVAGGSLAVSRDHLWASLSRNWQSVAIVDRGRNVSTCHSLG